MSLLPPEPCQTRLRHHVKAWQPPPTPQPMERRSLHSSNVRCYHWLPLFSLFYWLSRFIILLEVFFCFVFCKSRRNLTVDFLLFCRFKVYYCMRAGLMIVSFAASFKSLLNTPIETHTNKYVHILYTCTCLDLLTTALSRGFTFMVRLSILNTHSYWSQATRAAGEQISESNFY